MHAASIFVGRSGLRAGWRFVLFLVLAQGLNALLGVLVVKGLHYQPTEGWVATDFWISETLGFVAAIAATVLMARMQKRTVAEFGLPLVRRAPHLWCEGLVAGGVFVGVLMAGIAWAGGVSFHGWALAGNTLASAALRWGLAMVLLGFFEEYAFRGYPLVALGEGMGFWPAAAVLSLAFGALHYFTKPMESVADALNVSLIALLLCFSFRRTGSLWYAAGFHTAFDFAALVLFGAPNTGNQGKPLTEKLLQTEFHGPAWLTGGVCGMEASLLVLPVVAAAFWVLHRRFRDGRVALAAVGVEPVVPAAGRVE